MAARKSPPQRAKPTHPGVVMREILEEGVAIAIAEAARRMQVGRQSLYDVLDGKARVTAEFALRFGTLVGADPALYLHMQDELDLWEARAALKDTLAAIEPAPAKASG